MAGVLPLRLAGGLCALARWQFQETLLSFVSSATHGPGTAWLAPGPVCHTSCPVAPLAGHLVGSLGTPGPPSRPCPPGWAVSCGQQPPFQEDSPQERAPGSAASQVLASGPSLVSMKSRGVFSHIKGTHEIDFNLFVQYLHF